MADPILPEQGRVSTLPRGEGDATIDPTIAPYLAEALGRARYLFLQGPQPEMFPGQMYVSPSEQTLAAIQAQEDIAKAEQPLLSEAQNVFLRGLQAKSGAIPLYEDIYKAAGYQPGVSAYEQFMAGQYAPDFSELQKLAPQAATQVPSALTQVAGGEGLPSTAGIQGLAGQAMPGVSDIYGRVQAGQFQNLAMPGVQDVVGGSFLTGSPYQQALIEQSTRPITEQLLEQTLPALQSQFSRAGRYGSGAQERAIEAATRAAARAVGETATQIGAQTYAQERGFQEAARGLLAGLSQQDLANRLQAAQTAEATRQAQLAQAAGIQGQLFGAQAQNLQAQLAAGQTAEQMRQSGIGQQANILGQVAGLQQTGFGNILAGAQGLQGAQQAALGTQMSAAGGLGAAQQQALATQLATAQAAPAAFQQQFLPAQTLAQVGAQREAIAAQPLQEQMQRFQFQQQLPYSQLQSYLSSIYGNPLSAAQQPQQQGSSTMQNIGGLLGIGLIGTQLYGGLKNLGVFGSSGT